VEESKCEQLIDASNFGKYAASCASLAHARFRYMPWFPLEEPITLPPESLQDSTAIHTLISAARAGASREVGELLDICRQYLLLVANEELDVRLRAKLGASDVVQQTLLEAQVTFDHFSGDSEAALLAWLTKILKNNLADARRTFLIAEKRCVTREQSLQEYGAESQLAMALIADASSPSSHLLREELVEMVQGAMGRLSVGDREVLLLRHRDRLTFPEIGIRMNRSPDAARMLWWRAFERLSDLLEPLHDSLC
jgi:RNA polymerase sigma-70 factor (ECF subfamily)